MCKEVYKLMRQRIEDVPKLNMQENNLQQNSGSANINSN